MDSTIHLIVFFRTILHPLKFKKLKSLFRPAAVCPDCNRTWHRQTGRVGDEAGEPLLEENREEDVEASPKGKGAIRLEDNAEGLSLGQRS